MIATRHLAAFVILAGVSFAPAQPPKPDTPAKVEPPVVVRDGIAERKNQQITLSGKPFNYDSIAGTIPILDEGPKPLAGPTTKAMMFFVSYTKSPAPNEKLDAKRPLMFLFNGGPGSSSVWLHLGAFGPKRVQLANAAGEAPVPPGKLVDNEFTLLEQCDLVFVDPVATGLSRPAELATAKEFFGVNEDLAAMGEFIRLYLTRYHRWASPKFLCGESYGTTRAAGLAAHLQDRHGIDVNGLLLVSSVLNFGTLLTHDGNDLANALLLPSLTATAAYHEKLPPELKADLKKTLLEVEAFVAGEYTAALMKGDALTAEERTAVAKKIARYSGLTEEFVLRSNLRLDVGRFCKELLRDRRQTIGRYDARLTGVDRDAAGERAEYDPSYAAVQSAFASAMNNYLYEGLGYETDRPYEILTSKVQPWQYVPFQNRYLNVVPALRSAMAQNHNLRVFVASGLTDLATPYYATDYTFRHLGLEDRKPERVTLQTYEAGHMMYIHRPSLEKLFRDAVAFLGAVPK